MVEDLIQKKRESRTSPENKQKKDTNGREQTALKSLPRLDFGPRLRGVVVQVVPPVVPDVHWMAGARFPATGLKITLAGNSGRLNYFSDLQILAKQMELTLTE